MVERESTNPENPIKSFLENLRGLALLTRTQVPKTPNQIGRENYSWWD